MRKKIVVIFVFTLLIVSISNAISVISEEPFYNHDVGNNCKPENFILTHDIVVVGVLPSGPCVSGSQPILGFVENRGTDTETELTCYAEIWEYITDPINGTLIWADEETIDSIDPTTGSPITVTFGSFNFVNEGRYAIFVCVPLATDENPDDNCFSVTVFVDTTKPITTIVSMFPPFPTGENGWYMGSRMVTPRVTLDAVDTVSGVAVTYYTFDGGRNLLPYTGTYPFSFLVNPVHGCVKPGDFQYYSVDNCGNTENTNTNPTFKLDTRIPNKIFHYSPIANAYLGIGWDSCSGFQKMQFYAGIDPMGYPIPWGPPITNWFHIMWSTAPASPVSLTVWDNAGNENFL